ncbi:MAG TPA: hypothetical protein VN959_18080 [Mycobacterium sp.]|nr:hypothetical protein [Mycobacterium sp.]
MNADANILLTEHGEPQLTEFGVAISADIGGDTRAEESPARCNMSARW